MYFEPPCMSIVCTYTCIEENWLCFMQKVAYMVLCTAQLPAVIV